LGYCDEDLYDKALELIEKNRKKPFFLTLLTLSSHEPFDYPDGKITPYTLKKTEGFENAIKYADFALGKFVQALKEKGVLKDTVVALIADHNEHARGKFDVPIDSYKIAALILSNDYANKGQKYAKIASQIDFAPTMIDIAGVSATIPTMGISVLSYQRKQRFVVARKRNFA